MFLPEFSLIMLQLTPILVGKHKLMNQLITLMPETSKKFVKSKEILAEYVQLAHKGSTHLFNVCLMPRTAPKVSLFDWLQKRLLIHSVSLP